MIELPDFPVPLVAVIDKRTLTWSFKLAPGVTIIGTPAVTASRSAIGNAAGASDPAPQSRVLGTPQIGADQSSIQVRFGTCIGGVRYLLVLSFATSDGDTPAAFNHILCVTPD